MPVLRRPSATVRFYTGFFVALAVALGIVFAIGFHAGGSRIVRATSGTDVAGDRSCLRAAAAATRDAVLAPSLTPLAYRKFVRLLVAAQSCARRYGLPYLAQGDVAGVTGVTVSGDRYDPSDAMWKHATGVPQP